MSNQSEIFSFKRVVEVTTAETLIKTHRKEDKIKGIKDKGRKKRRKDRRKKRGRRVERKEGKVR